MERFPCSEGLRTAILQNLQQFTRQKVEPGFLKQAAVALTVVDFRQRGRLEGLAGADPESAALILTRRAGGLKSHGGQWAFPGGRMEKGEGVKDAALRELHEEVGLELPQDRVLGCLDDYVTRSGYHITPVVIWGGPTAELRKNEREVSSVHRIPLGELFHPENPMLSDGVDEDRPVLYMAVGNTCIASPTAAIWYQFREAALCGRATRVAHFDQPFFAWS